ncbi:hypothetical protein TBLA_0G03380 [Henningerozyma blattae CBS 6284]|uniref:Rab-GAP TBC domain-containing protein n=1 Tax=Henningerozyma blattae (strain ATCC 34711 / CBS 6284 / DSM 70876 / NBRC 10599 / NRRL Y-10934 / UCD 77-7) TaxID=1071380 RepID=I2H7C3_HENB6|nr:hypothetical protein TBLA_0G03380 [Tetrapisispora blattae CBS 6284]CCH62275.1 hypothetical protein TBLA_0G03380 [Tetrapisispora blattae CBS 6284]
MPAKEDDNKWSSHYNLLKGILNKNESIYSFFNDDEKLTLRENVIAHALTKDNRNILREIGQSEGGFESLKLRKDCWYELLLNQLDLARNFSNQNFENAKPHPDENQVHLDVLRSFGFVEDHKQKEKLRSLLEKIIVNILRKYPTLRYYQGYHDIVAVFIIVFMVHPYQKSVCEADEEYDIELTRQVSEKFKYSTHRSGISIASSVIDPITNETMLFRSVEIFTLIYLRDFMMDSLTFPILQTKIIPAIVKRYDKQLYMTLKLDKMQPFFAIPSLLTLFSHQFKPTELSNGFIYQVFDLIISSQSMFISIIMYMHLILMSKDSLLQEYALNAGNFENDIDLLHGVMQQQMIKNITNEKFWSIVLIRTQSSIKKPLKLKNARKMVDEYSVLRTTASGSNHRYNIKYVQNVLAKEIKASKKLDSYSKHKTKGCLKSPLLNIAWQSYSKNNILFKVSILIIAVSFIYKTQDLTQIGDSLSLQHNFHSISKEFSSLMTNNINYSLLKKVYNFFTFSSIDFAPELTDVTLDLK